MQNLVILRLRAVAPAWSRSTSSGSSHGS